MKILINRQVFKLIQQKVNKNLDKNTINNALARCMSQWKNDQIRFDGQTAIVTGAGRGLGREYALLLSSRGANVVVNDFVGSKSGDKGTESQVADELIAEIKKANPNSKALANYESVSCENGVQKLVDATIREFGRVDILINNAGILRDRSFGKMSIEDWDLVNGIHLRGSFLTSRACWPYMRSQNYGKIIMTSSTSGLYGNFGQANYAAAKMGLIGLSHTLAIEGKKNNISSNCIVPSAASRMTLGLIKDDLANRLNPAYVAPLVAWLCHKDCKETGGIFEAAGQWFGQHKLHRTNGKVLAGICENDKSETLESIANNWTEITKFDDKAKYVESYSEHLEQLMQAFQRKS